MKIDDMKRAIEMAEMLRKVEEAIKAFSAASSSKHINRVSFWIPHTSWMDGQYDAEMQISELTGSKAFDLTAESLAEIVRVSIVLHLQKRADYLADQLGKMGADLTPPVTETGESEA